MQISSQFRKPNSPLKQTHPKYITSPPCVSIGYTRQEVGSLHSLHSLQQPYLRPLIHTTQNITKHFRIANMYIPPQDSTSTQYKPAGTDIQHCIQYITNILHSGLTGDVNAHSTLWHSYTDDHKGQLIADVISNSDHITLNTNQSVKHHTTTSSPRCLAHCTTGHRGQLNTHYHQTT